MMENREYLNNLFDVYKDLLTKIEQDTFMDYYFDDLSLTEIAENRQISKSSVSKTLKQVSIKLKEYEDKLHIYELKKEIKEILKERNLAIIKERLTKII